MAKDHVDSIGLEALEDRIASGFQKLNHPPADWTPPRQGPDGRPATDVLIVGAGMQGLGAAFALRRLGISNIVHVDRSEQGLEGPWLTYARMEKLRSPKHLVGPAQGLPDLTFRAWWEARFGPEGWEALGHIERADWARYLGWFCRVTGADVQPKTRLTALRPQGDLIAATLEGDDGARLVHARQVVLATGREGLAAPRTPAPFAPWFGGRVLHSSDDIDFAALAGRRVVVIGLSASAFDNACLAAEHGAEVTLLGRAEATPTVNKMKQTVYPGFAHGFPDLPARDRLGWLTAVARGRIAPPRHTVQRAARAGVRLIEGVETERVEEADDGGLTLHAGDRRFEADLVILGTGFRFDLSAAPELAELRPRVAVWRDVVPDAMHGERLDCPVLGPGFELTA
ncbi:MAG: NAD(P)/FAD-dependent oxidoreductase, partial [Pseudomonadota bacterium]